jgi:hypothetical protein
MMPGRFAQFMAIAILIQGCATTPSVKPADPDLLLSSGLLSFLQDGATSREVVVLKLGVPSAQLEGDRILMYQLRSDEQGTWYLTAPEWDTYAGLRSWKPGTCSLVLVFDEDGVLRRHSLVVPQSGT